MNEKNLSVITALDYKTLNAGRLLKTSRKQRYFLRTATTE